MDNAPGDGKSFGMHGQSPFIPLRSLLNDPGHSEQVELETNCR